MLIVYLIRENCSAFLSLNTEVFEGNAVHEEIWEEATTGE